MGDKYDAIVIGSGVGGLTCASFLARAGMKVLVLEQHTKIGGYSHSFKRRSFTFESGIHSVPIAEKGLIKYLLNLLGVDNMIEKTELPEMYHTIMPGGSITMPSKKEDIDSFLREKFPHQKQNLKNLFNSFREFEERLVSPIYTFEDKYVEEDREFVIQFHNVSYQQYISKFIDDDRLKNVFFAQWPYGGASHDYGGALFYAMMFILHYIEGTHTLKNGFSTLAQALAHAITSRGGVIKTKNRVTRVITENGHAKSVVTADGEEYEANLFISNISPYLLHNQLIDTKGRNRLWTRRLSNLNPSVSAVIVYLGLNRDISGLIPNNTNFWYSSENMSSIFKNIMNNRHDSPEHLILLKPFAKTTPPTLTLLYFLKKSASADWKKDKCLFAERMLAKAGELYPGLSDVVDLMEIGSPETFERYTANTDGALYGFENTRDVYGEAKLPVNTHLQNLYQTGHWGKPGCGIWNVMVNAYNTYQKVMIDMQAQPKVKPGYKKKDHLTFRLIYPRFKKFLEDNEALDSRLKKHLVGNYTMPPSLALPIIAALTPSDIEVGLTDDNIGDKIDYDEQADLVVISCFTPQAGRAYIIADEFRKRGKKVIIGGIHPTAIPQEAQQHADAICIGEVEPVWAEICRDIGKGRLKPVYQANTTYSLSEFPIPKREIFKQDIYNWNAHLVLTTRGCPVRCDGCPIPGKEGTRVRLRPIDNIIEDIKQMPYREFYFTDDTIMLPGKKYLKFITKLMKRLQELDVRIFLASTMMMVNDPAFFKKLKAGGATSMYTVFGFDTISRNLFSRECSPQEWQYCIDLVRMVEDAGIHFFASFGVGFDDQDPGVFERIIRFTEEGGVDLAEFFINTPYPGTPFGHKAEKEKRILHRNYDLWNQGNVVFKPKNFTEKELHEGFYDLWHTFYSDKDSEKTLRTFTLSNK